MLTLYPSNIRSSRQLAFDSKTLYESISEHFGSCSVADQVVRVEFYANNHNRANVASSLVMHTHSLTRSLGSRVTLLFATHSHRYHQLQWGDHSKHGTLASSSSVAAAWYAGWHAEDFPISSVSWSKYTILTYAFATTTPQADRLSLEDSDKQLLPKFVEAAHQNHVKASLSIGGWAGSRYFSSNVGSPENRTSFVGAITQLVHDYHLDGIDFDWEYPNRQGIGCNIVSPNDVPNFLSLLQELRKHPLGSNLTLSAAVSIQPYTSPDGKPADMSDFSEVLDYIAIMNYDVWTSASNLVGPNAPLNDTCVDASSRAGSAVSAVKAWTGVGIPANRIVLGVPAYGHSYAVNASSAFDGSSNSNATLKSFPTFDPEKQPHGDRWDGGAGMDVCGNPVSAEGIFDFWGLAENGFISAANGSAVNGITAKFDECSQTPFVYNSTSGVLISYDDARSFAAKGKFIKSNGLAGFAIWEAGGDSHDMLLDSIRAFSSRFRFED
ncbi:hypothetical protein ONZ45_g4793 [Pleurotus djamor]|nr:hypothetical protein ONZ45_g4793 [Pleurotus djamor]